MVLEARLPIGACLSARTAQPHAFACAVHGSGSGAIMRGTFLAVFIGSRPSVASPSGTPHSAQCPPEPLHTQVTKCVQTRCLPHPASPTLTPWSRSPFQTASWQRLGRHGRQHMLHVLLHGPVDVRRRLLGALLSPLAPLRSPPPSITPMRHTRSASVPTRCSTRPLRRSRSHARTETSAVAKKALW